MNFKKYHIAALFTVMLCMNLTTTAQIAVAQVTPEDAVEELVSGVQYSNVTFTGTNIQLGRLTGSMGTIFAPDGIVLACADATNLETGAGNDLNGTGTNGDPDLLDIANSVPPLIGQTFSVSAVNDVAALEFDFIPCGDSISFNYTFGSNEYLTYVNSSFNDIFAFFLSGPGITGPYASPVEFPDGAVNIAQVPNSDPPLPITISSVNNVLNQQYYIDNPGNVDIVCNGFTTVLTAQYPVVSGETYHIKLAVADGSDDFLESYVVLEAGSFSSNVSANVEIINAPPNFPPMTVLEGCVEAELSVTRPSLETDSVQLNISGTAISGIDYEQLPDWLVFPEGEETITIDFQSLFDTEIEGTESVFIEYTTVDECTGVIAETVIELFIQDYLAPEMDLPETINLCNGESQTVQPTITNGTPPFIYEWTTEESTPTIIVSSDSPSPFSLFLTDYCETTVTDQSEIIVPSPLIVPDEIELCLGESVDNFAQGGAQPYSITYSTDSISFANGLYTPIYTGLYDVIVVDECGESGISLVDVDVCTVAIPNIFSPNSDAINDQFVIQGNLDGRGNALIVYNRWGTVVYESADYNNNWEGDELVEGTYFYKYTHNDGTEYTGTLTLVRD